MNMSKYRNNSSGVSRIIVAALTVCLSSFAPKCAGDTLRTVALTGTPIPGMSPGVTFRRFDPPVLNNAGQTAFTADLQFGSGGVDENNDRGLWSEGHGALALVARKGGFAPGTPEAKFDRVYYPVLNNAGQTIFYSTLQQGSGDVVPNNSYGVWSEGSGLLQLVARAGNQAPSAPEGATFDYIDEPHFLVLNTAGATALDASMQVGKGGVTADTNIGIWIGRTDSLELAVRGGDQPPGAPAGAKFDDFSNVVLNDVGEYAFRGVFNPVDAVTRFDRQGGIWAYRDGLLQLIAHKGERAPDTPNGSFFRSFGPPAFNDAAQVAFTAELVNENGVVEYPDHVGIWAEHNGSLRLVARSGSQAPGTPDGVSFNDFNTSDSPEVTMDGAGNIAFFGYLRGESVNAGNETGIWSEARSGDLELVVRAGDPAPGAPAGAKFRSVGGPRLNATGQIAFVGQLQSGAGGVSLASDLGIWAQDRDGVLQMIVREGDLVDVDDGPGTDFRTVTGFSLFYPWRGTGNQDGRPSAFNDLGQLAFLASFTDRSSGIFVSSLAAIPEPASVVLAAMTLVGLFHRPRRSRC